MTRYSASRGIRYSAPPGPDGNRQDGDEEEEAEEPSAAAVEADGSGTDAAADD